MSRLDDELRNAFKRQQPPADFTARVLERVARQPEPRPSLWQRLAALVEPPKMRWVAIGVTAALLIAIGAAQYSRLANRFVDNTGKLSEAEAAKDKLMLALSIASSALNDAQKAVHDDGPKP